jgi:hypothetical protein
VYCQIRYVLVITCLAGLPIGEGLGNSQASTRVVDDEMTDDASSVQSLFGAGPDKLGPNAIEQLVDLMQTSNPDNPLMAYLSILSTSMNPGITAAASKAALAILSARWPAKLSDESFQKEIKKDMNGDGSVDSLLAGAIKASIREAVMCALADEGRVKKYLVALLQIQTRIVEVKLQSCYG